MGSRISSCCGTSTIIFLTPICECHDRRSSLHARCWKLKWYHYIFFRCKSVLFFRCFYHWCNCIIPSFTITFLRLVNSVVFHASPASPLTLLCFMRHRPLVFHASPASCNTSVMFVFAWCMSAAPRFYLVPVKRKRSKRKVVRVRSPKQHIQCLCIFCVKEVRFASPLVCLWDKHSHVTLRFCMTVTGCWNTLLWGYKPSRWS